MAPKHPVMAQTKPKADMLIEFLDKTGKPLPLKDDTDLRRESHGFIMVMLFLTDDGVPFEGRVKRFAVPFRARDMDLYLADWRSWRMATPAELADARRVRSAKSAAAPLPDSGDAERNPL